MAKQAKKGASERNSYMNWRTIWIIIGILVFVFILFNILQSVPQYNDLNDDEQELLHNLSNRITEGKETDLDKIGSILIFLRTNIDFSAEEGYEKNISYSHRPLDILKRRWGLCYDFSYMFELMAQSSGYKTRHVALTKLAPKETHAVSEVKIDSKWVFFDPSSASYYTDKAGMPLSAEELLDKEDGEIIKINLIQDYDIFPPNEFDHIVYGVYNLHGKQFSPKIAYPDLIFGQLYHNISNEKLPSRYKNMAYMGIIGLVVLICLVILLIKIKNVRH